MFYKPLKQEVYEKFWKILKQGKESKQEIFEKFCKLSKQPSNKSFGKLLKKSKAKQASKYENF